MHNYSIAVSAALAIGAITAAPASATPYRDAVLSLNPAAYYDMNESVPSDGAASSTLVDHSGYGRDGIWGPKPHTAPIPIAGPGASAGFAGLGSSNQAAQLGRVEGASQPDGTETEYGSPRYSPGGADTYEGLDLNRHFSLGDTDPDHNPPDGGWMNQPSMTYSYFLQAQAGGWWSNIIKNQGRRNEADGGSGSYDYVNDFRMVWYAGNIYLTAGDHNDPFVGNTTYRTTSTLSQNEWHHIVATREAEGPYSTPTFNLWVNGEQVDLEYMANPNANLTAMYGGNWQGEPHPDAHHPYIGIRDNNELRNWGYFTGAIDELAIFQGALSESDVELLYAAATSELDILLGDMNGDGQLDFDDINPFMLALNDPGAYESQYGLDPNVVGDINSDGQLDFDDINPFVALLSGDGSAVVPEPATLSLLALGGLAALSRRRRMA